MGDSSAAADAAAEVSAAVLDSSLELLQAARVSAAATATAAIESFFIVVLLEVDGALGIHSRPARMAVLSSGSPARPLVDAIAPKILQINFPET